MNSVKYCPHCGGDARLTANYSPKVKRWFIAVKCTLCGATGKYYTQVEDPDETNWNTDACYNALRAWNRRYNPLIEDDDAVYKDGDASRRVM